MYSTGALDYSLLVGIHRVDGSGGRLAALLEQGGVASTDRQCVYFFGIIDVLERHSLRWKAQRLLLSLGYRALLRPADADGSSAPPPAGTPRRAAPLPHAQRVRAGISALPPAEYADRFLHLHRLGGAAPRDADARRRQRRRRWQR